MVTECVYGQLKGRWRISYRKSECTPAAMKDIVLACIVLHNICINKEESFPTTLNVCNDQEGETLSQDRIRERLAMLNGHAIYDNAKGTGRVRDTLKNKFWEEKMSSCSF